MSCVCVRLFVSNSVPLDANGWKTAIILQLNELNETVTLTSAPLFRVWLSHALAYIRWMRVAMNANPSMSAILIKFQTNNSQPLRPRPRRSPPSSYPFLSAVYIRLHNRHSHTWPTFFFLLLPFLVPYYIIVYVFRFSSPRSLSLLNCLFVLAAWNNSSQVTQFLCWFPQINILLHSVLNSKLEMC